PGPARLWERRVRGLLARSGLTDAAVRLTVTRGTAGEGLAPEGRARPTLLLTARRLPAHLARRQREGVAVVLLPFPRDAGPPWGGLKLVGHASAVAGRVAASRRAGRGCAPARALIRLAPGGAGIPPRRCEWPLAGRCGDEAAEPALRRQADRRAARRDGRRAPPAPRARAGDPHLARCGRDHRSRHLRADRARCERLRRSRPDSLLRLRRDRLCARRPLLRRVRLDGAGRGQRLHLRVRDPGRAVCVDHRLGPGPRVRRRLEHGGAWLVALLPLLSAALRRDAAGALDGEPDRLRPGDARLGTHGRDLQPPGSVTPKSRRKERK